MSRARTPAQTITCECGCGRTGEHRGPRPYIKPCYERWRRQGRPEDGPAPATLTRARTEEQVQDDNRRRRRWYRRRWARELAEELGRAQATSATEPEPVPGWGERAACRGTASELAWFAKEPPEELGRMCDRCPVRTSCLVHALTRPEYYGTWSGQSQADLRNLRKRLRDAARTASQTAS